MNPRAGETMSSGSQVLLFYPIDCVVSVLFFYSIDCVVSVFLFYPMDSVLLFYPIECVVSKTSLTKRTHSKAM
jgi:hypothetical protein